MGYKGKISVDAEVDIEIDDVMAELSDEDLIDELKERDINVGAELIGELDDDEMKELIAQKYDVPITRLQEIEDFINSLK